MHRCAETVTTLRKISM